MAEGSTFKVYLTAEQWARICAEDEEIRSEVEKQQPEMFATFDKDQPKKGKHHRPTVIEK